MSIKPTNFEDTYQFSQEAFKSMQGKEGFELYQAYRDALLSLIFDKPDGMKKYSRSMFEQSDIIGLNLVDQKYIDNFLLCTTIKLSASEVYEDLKEIIDKNVQPDKRSQGWSHVYKEMSGAFAYFLDLYENVSARQAYHMSSNFFGVANSEVKKKHLKLKADSTHKGDSLPDIYTLALLFYCLMKKKFSVEVLRPIATKSQRSEKELKSAIQGYERFKKRIFDHYRAIEEAGLYELANDLNRVFVERLNIDVIRELSNRQKEERLGSIKELACLVDSLGLDGRKFTAFIAGCYELRHGVTHLPSSSIKEAYELAGLKEENTPMLNGEILILNVANTIGLLSNIIRRK